ncbi:aspartyl protease family protein At5g10770-like isoform X1 [Triticum urartu]|uniref:Peptidase A1 domain-containing protein n=1 Tax=Triticum urartu TaxID=4572 RepID=A0A8R7UG65_TRIUA|nr:aspartyl protease family protein At5g10770-like isoform X1 [Triticum urartu]
MARGGARAVAPAALLLLLLLAAGGGVHCLRSRAESGATVLELRHHASLGSGGRSGSAEEACGVLASDAARVSSLQRRIGSYGLIRSSDAASKLAQVPVTSGARLRTLNYVATVGIGGGEATVIVDTASELTWVQCKPCDACHDQQEPLFDPSASPSYAAVPCNSSSCDALRVATGMSGGQACDQPAACSYALSYRDGSYSRGVLAHDRLSLAGEDIEGFVFGCGTSNQGPFGGTSGLMGLGRSPLSLISQTTEQFGGVFSYCLPPKESGSSGSLVLGDDASAYRNSTPIVYTAMVTDPLQGPFYMVNLTGISVGGEEVQSPGFSAGGGGGGRAIVDSGTIITSLVPSVYAAVRGEFVRQLAEYPRAPAFSILDTCFDLTGLREVQVPSLRLAFDGGAEVEVDSKGVLYVVAGDASQVCLALAALGSEDDTPIIGNYQQKNLRVVFDTAASQIGFAQETCDYI